MPSDIVEKAKTHGAKLTAKYSVNDTKAAFSDWLQDASAEEMHLLTEAFAIAHSGGNNIVDVILHQLGMRDAPTEALPPQVGASESDLPETELRAARLRDLKLGTYEFAEHLETAQVMWRRYPDLVESEDFPEPFLSAYRRNSGKGDPHSRYISVWDDKLVEAGVLPKPRRMRFNKARLHILIREELINGFDDIADRWAEDASVTDLAVMHALLNTNRKPLDVLSDLLICEGGSKDDQEPANLGGKTGSRSDEESSAAGA
jgi:hypothetical protein